MTDRERPVLVVSWAVRGSWEEPPSVGGGRQQVTGVWLGRGEQRVSRGGGSVYLPVWIVLRWLAESLLLSLTLRASRICFTSWFQFYNVTVCRECVVLVLMSAVSLN